MAKRVRFDSINSAKLRKQAQTFGGLQRLTASSGIDYSVWLRIVDGMEPGINAAAFLAQKGYRYEDWLEPAHRPETPAEANVVETPAPGVDR